MSCIYLSRHLNFVSLLKPLVLRDAIWSWLSGWGECWILRDCLDERVKGVWLVILEEDEELWVWLEVIFCVLDGTGVLNNWCCKVMIR